jgi:hypothetical protein
VPVTAAPRRAAPAATGRAVKRSEPKSKPVAKKKIGTVALAARAPQRLVPRDPTGSDRGLLALAGVLLGVVAIGGAVLGGGYRHAFGESHP